MFNFVLAQHRKTSVTLLLLVANKPTHTTQLGNLWKIFDNDYFPTHAGQAFTTESGFMIFTGGSISLNLDVEGIDLIGINKLISQHEFATIETEYENDDLLLLTNIDFKTLPSKVYVEEDEKYTNKELREYHVNLIDI